MRCLEKETSSRTTSEQLIIFALYTVPADVQLAHHDSHLVKMELDYESDESQESHKHTLNIACTSDTQVLNSDPAVLTTPSTSYVVGTELPDLTSVPHTQPNRLEARL